MATPSALEASSLDLTIVYQAVHVCLRYESRSPQIERDLKS